MINKYEAYKYLHDLYKKELHNNPNNVNSLEIALKNYKLMKDYPWCFSDKQNLLIRDEICNYEYRIQTSKSIAHQLIKVGKSWKPEKSLMISFGIQDNAMKTNWYVKSLSKMHIMLSPLMRRISRIMK